jgi:hypothetical protein
LPNCVRHVPPILSPVTAPSKVTSTCPSGVVTFALQPTLLPETWTLLSSETPFEAFMVPCHAAPAGFRSQVNFCVPIGVSIEICHLPATLIVNSRAVKAGGRDGGPPGTEGYRSA